MTTRYDEQFFSQAFFGTLHESGHGIYEQGLLSEHFGTPMGSAVSLGIHESQSRMWENFVGRSRAFWEHFYGPAQQQFPDALQDVSLDEFYAAINDVRPSFIRVEADEVTYNLHIMLRFELEQPLIAGDLPPADVPGVWNETFERYFGLTPDNDAVGCMQDVHWSAGLIGYFPTYALGNMYAAQFFNKATSDLGDLDKQFAAGEFTPLRDWLRTQHPRARPVVPGRSAAGRGDRREPRLPAAHNASPQKVRSALRTRMNWRLELEMHPRPPGNGDQASPDNSSVSGATLADSRSQQRPRLLSFRESTSVCPSGRMNWLPQVSHNGPLTTDH